jgi:hypothetical protein
MTHPTTAVIFAITITILLRVWSIPLIRGKVFGWVGKLPRFWQWVAPLALAMLASAGQGWIDGLRGTALLEQALADGGQIGAMAIGLWHTAKRLTTGDSGESLLNALAAPKGGPPIAPS